MQPETRGLVGGWGELSANKNCWRSLKIETEPHREAGKIRTTKSRPRGVLQIQEVALNGPDPVANKRVL